jgi:thiol-disulfide isomerase/thioredoxin
MYSKIMLIYGGVILCLALIYLVWRGKYVGGEGFADAAAGEPEFVMLYADWCGHCKKAKPDFEKLAASSPLNIGTQKVRVRLVDGETEEAKKFSVEGFPTFILMKPDGSQVRYEGGRNVDGYKEFLTQQLA